MTTETASTDTPPTRLSMPRAMLLVFAPFACGYFFSYFYRTANAVIAPDLRADVGVGPAELGLLTATYFLTFAACQIPLGLLLDRYGPRRVQGLLYGVAALGALLFSYGEDVSTLMLARALIGVGVSGGLMAALKAIVQWFPRERLALVNGWYFASGAFGALAATRPLEFALQFMDWRGLFVVLAIATAAAAVLILLVVPDKPDSRAGGSLRRQVQELGEIYRDPYFWRVVPLMFTGASANMAIQGLWAGPWLAEVDGFGREVVANHLLVMAFAMLVGVSLSGVFAAALQRLGLTLAGACGTGALLTIASLLLVVTRVGAGETFSLPGIRAPLEATYLVWAFVGFSGTLTSLVFAALGQHFPEARIGRGNTAANVMVFLTSFGYQFGMGAIIEQWTPDAGGSYPVEAYTVAFLATIATMVVAFVWFVWPIRGRYR